MYNVYVVLHVIFMPFLYYIINSPGPCLAHHQAMRTAMRCHFDHRLDFIAGMLEDAKHEGWQNVARVRLATG